MKQIVRNNITKPNQITDHAAIIRALAMEKETLIVKPSLHQRYAINDDGSKQLILVLEMVYFL